MMYNVYSFCSSIPIILLLIMVVSFAVMCLLGALFIKIFYRESFLLGFSLNFLNDYDGNKALTALIFFPGLLCFPMLYILTQYGVKKERVTQKITAAVCLFCCIMLIFGNTSIIHLMGCRDIRSLHRGEYYYYAVVRTETDRIYTLPVKIATNQKGGNFRVEYIYWPNGGYTKLYNNGYTHKLEYALSLDETYYDDNDEERYYNILLLNKKAEPKGYESPFVIPAEIVSAAVSVIILLLYLFFISLNLKRQAAQPQITAESEEFRE